MNAFLVNGLGGEAGFGENSLVRVDDFGSQFIDVTDVFENGLNFFGTRYNGFFLNNNGNITFESSLSTFTPFQITENADQPIIAPFFADVDTRSGPVTTSPGGNSQGTNLTYWDIAPARNQVTLTWDDVGAFSLETDPNAFQLILTDLNEGNFQIEFRYEELQWVVGSASGDRFARAGYSAADGENAFELPQSGDAEQILDLVNVTNVGEPGVIVFSVINGIPSQAPIDIVLSSANIDENSPRNTVIGDLTTVDLDVGDTHTYSLLDSAEGRFRIVGDELLVANGSLLDFESDREHVVTIRTTDQNGLNYDEEFTITVNDIEEIPIIPTPVAPNHVGRSKGEPHITTFDGVGYDFQAAGEFTLVESDDGQLNVQIRYVELTDNVSVASAVATEIDGQNIVIDAEGVEIVEGRALVTRRGGNEATVKVDGRTVDIAVGESFTVGTGRIFRNSTNQYAVVYAGSDEQVGNGDDQLIVNYYGPGILNIVDVALGNAQKEKVSGLLGNLNRDPDDDIALANGRPLERPLVFEDLYGEYRDDWRVKTRAQSLFDYSAGQGPGTFFNPDFPAVRFTYADLSPAERNRGNAAARAAGYTPGTFEFESAAFDFAVIGEQGLLAGSESDPDVEVFVPTEPEEESPTPTEGERINGTENRDRLTGTDGNDRIKALDSNDRASGLDGNDVILGGDGNDTLFGDDGADKLLGGDGNDKLLGGDGNDVLKGEDDDDRLIGGDGNDRLLGNDGNDTVSGGAGNDSLIGGDGNDVLKGDAGDDKLIGGKGNDRLIGSAGNDRLIGGDGADSLLGGSGNDKLIGNAGNDTLSAGSGNDRLIGGGDNDSLDGGGGDDILLGGDRNDVLSGGSGQDKLNGGVGNDELVGGTGSDFLIGGSGRDVLAGGRGNDTLIGGTGRDVFVLASNSGTDIIRDFEEGTDRIGLDGQLQFGSLTLNSSRNSLQILLGRKVLAELQGVSELQANDFVRV